MPNTTTRRSYVNNAPRTTLTGAITNTATSVPVASLTGWPGSYPYLAVLEANTVNEEIVLVTSAVGTTLTVTRAQDGTAGVSHLGGATLDHGIVRQDVDESNAHTSATSGVHGVAGAVVGTTDTQTLTSKTLTSPVINGGQANNLTALTTTAGATIGTTLAVTGNETVGGTLAVTGQVTAPTKVAANEMIQVSFTAQLGMSGSTQIWVQNATTTDYNTLGVAALTGSYAAVTIPAGKGGKYRVSGQVCVTTTTGRVRAAITTNDVNNMYLATSLGSNGVSTTMVPIGPRVITLNAGDIVKLAVFASQSGNFDITTGTSGNDTFLLIERLG